LEWLSPAANFCGSLTAVWRTPCGGEIADIHGADARFAGGGEEGAFLFERRFTDTVILLAIVQVGPGEEEMGPRSEILLRTRRSTN